MKPQQNTYDYGECEIYDTSKRILETELPEDSDCPQEVQRLSWLMGTSWRLRSVRKGGRSLCNGVIHLPAEERYASSACAITTCQLVYECYVF